MLAVPKLNCPFLTLYVQVLHCKAGFLPLTLIIIALAASVAICVMASVMPAQMPLILASDEIALCESAWFLSSSLLCVRHLSFYY